MRKLLAILVLLLYLPAISGMAINSFYCCGKLDSVKIQLISNMGVQHSPDEKDNCCKNNMQYLKVHDAQQASVSQISVKAPVLSLNFIISILEAGSQTYNPDYIHDGHFCHSPHIQNSVPLFLQNEILLI